MTAPTQPLPDLPRAVNPVTSAAPAGRPWLCRVHRVAGGAKERTCCQAAKIMVAYADRVDWYSIRVADKPAHVRIGIMTTLSDLRWSLRVLSRHAFASERAWIEDRAAPAKRDEVATQLLRVVAP